MLECIDGMYFASLTLISGHCHKADSTVRTNIIEPSKTPNTQQFPVSVMMESKPSSSPWLDLSWDAVGICGINADDQSSSVKQITHGDKEQFIYNNLTLRLFLDECESYYHNLMSPQPGCFVVAREDEDNNSTQPIPFLVTMSFDEAHAYQEGDDLVYAVPIPAELYPWIEAYVVDNYSAEKRKKRKRKDWRKGE